MTQVSVQPPFRYPDWTRKRLSARRHEYACAGEPGLLSFVTTVWNTPLEMLRIAAASLLQWQTVTDFQWVVLDNGSTDRAVVQYLRDSVAADARVVYLRVEKNLGIIGGMRLVLSKATGRYVLPFDSDDSIYPDAVAIFTHQLRANNYPPLMYTDEDKVDGNELCKPYFKPDWDPVLFLNCCYIAHMGCLDRKLAIELGVYTDAGCEGCHDWDAFVRFMLAGHMPVHIPEMIYTWRIHQNSTAGNIGSKSYVYDSQRNVLARFLAKSPHREKFELRLSPLFNGNPEWWMQRKPVDIAPILSLVLSSGPVVGTNPLPKGLDNQPQFLERGERISARSDVREILPTLKNHSGLVCITFDNVRLNQPLWPFEVTGIFELHPDTVMIGGRIIHPSGRIFEAGRVPGFGGLYGCPDRGRTLDDSGNIAEMWKQRSVSGVSTHLCVMRVEFLREVIEAFSHRPISWFFLGAWAALLAWRNKQRIVYTPFLIGLSDIDPDMAVTGDEAESFRAEAGHFLPDNRYYNRHFSMNAGQGYLPISGIEPLNV